MLCIPYNTFIAIDLTHTRPAAHIPHVDLLTHSHLFFSGMAVSHSHMASSQNNYTGTQTHLSHIPSASRTTTVKSKRLFVCTSFCVFVCFVFSNTRHLCKTPSDAVYLKCHYILCFECALRTITKNAVKQTN